MGFGRRQISGALCAITASLLLIFVTTAGKASVSVTFDGLWWQDLTPLEPINAVEGILVGYQAGVFDSLNAGTIQVEAFVKYSKQHMSKAAFTNATIESYRSPFPSLGNATFGTI